MRRRKYSVSKSLPFGTVGCFLHESVPHTKVIILTWGDLLDKLWAEWNVVSRSNNSNSDIGLNLTGVSRGHSTRKLGRTEQ